MFLYRTHQGGIPSLYPNQSVDGNTDVQFSDHNERVSIARIEDIIGAGTGVDCGNKF